jgi:imidazolonepropionase-like amidohydrolase
MNRLFVGSLKRVLRCVLVAGLLVGVLSAEPRASLLVFLHVTVINPGTGSVEKNRAVVIREGRIDKVVNAAGFHAPAGAKVVDETGRYMIPGLWDMHVHSAFGDWFPRGREVILPLFVANGVTGVRDMGGDVPVLFGWRKEIAAGYIVGPRMVVSGPMLDGYLPGGKTTRFPSSIPVMTAEEARTAVDSLKAQGVDFIKIQSVIPHDAYVAAAEEAHKDGLPLVGHVPDHIKITEAVSLGQVSIEHFMGVLEGCSSQEDKLLAGSGDTKLMLRTYDDAKCQSLIALLAKTHTWQTPTMAWNRQGTFLDRVDMAHQPLDKYVPVVWRTVTWKRFYDEMMPGVTADPLVLRKEWIQQMLHEIGELHKGGVEFMAGTDTAPGIYVMPGFSLHDELANFVEAGFTPMEALATATSNPAKFLGKTDMGVIAPGMVADVVVLDANPLEKIGNTERIRAVVADGRYYDRARLDAMLIDVEHAAKK